MSERNNVIPLFQERPIRPEMRAHLIQRLVDLDTAIEPLAREAENIRRRLGLLAVERGASDE